MTRKGNLSALQKIGAEVAKYFNSPQVLWVSLRDFAVANCVRCKSGLLRDVEDFCFAVFDCLEPNVLREEREHRMIHVSALAVPLNLRIVDAGRRLTASDNTFRVKWTEATKETKRTEETKGTKVTEATRETKKVCRSLKPLPSLSSFEGGSNG